MSSQTKTSVSDKVLEIFNPTPVLFDSDSDYDTKAKLVDKYDEESENEGISSFKRNISILEEQGERYIGRRVSRRALDADNVQEDHPVCSQEMYTDTEDNGDDTGDSDEITEQSEGELDVSDVSDDQRKKGDAEKDDESHVPFTHMSRQDVKADVNKGRAVRHQLTLWDNLLECRIQLQKCLIAANKLPQYDMFTQFEAAGGAEYKTLTKNCKKSTIGLLERLISLREALLASNTETRNLGSVQETGKCLSDEEIPSDTDVEDNGEVDKKEDVVPQPKKRKLDDYEGVLRGQQEQFKNYRNGTIQKWNEKTRIAVGNASSRNFSAFEQSTLKQIEQVLSNRQRLILRTRLKRSVFDVLGKQPSRTIGTTDVNGSEEKVNDKEFDAEIFDDSDFYHQLLRELIERKTVGVTDPVQLGRQWIQIQKLRSKMKRKIDVRATKGRKIRYVVHPKLVNFTAPVTGCTWSDDAKNELYGSLFGNKHN